MPLSVRYSAIYKSKQYKCIEQTKERTTKVNVGDRG